jgi:hypothetical protein
VKQSQARQSGKLSESMEVGEVNCVNARQGCTRDQAGKRRRRDQAGSGADQIRQDQVLLLDEARDHVS